ncbi:MAG: DoxX family protein, partial [Flavobacteriales bacterium]
MKTAVLISRILVGALFIVSGLVKLNDPLGFSYKLEEYFSPDVLNMDWMMPYALLCSVVFSVLEVALGIAVLAGFMMRLSSWLLLGMMAFFTFLTFYSAYFEKVTECGCFGDALKIMPWHSFWKDVVLLVFVILIFIRQKSIKLNSPGENLIILPVALALIAAFSLLVIDWGFPAL